MPRRWTVCIVTVALPLLFAPLASAETNRRLRTLAELRALGRHRQRRHVIHGRRLSDAGRQCPDLVGDVQHHHSQSRMGRHWREEHVVVRHVDRHGDPPQLLDEYVGDGDKTSSQAWQVTLAGTLST
jgi:hypothetical protein